jgi:predicted ATPase/DNA-binding CsgD family transcriptional regulator
MRTTSVPGTDLRTETDCVLPSRHNGEMTATGGGTATWLARAGVTERETEVLLAIAERLGNREIADRLHLSVRTVESHIASLRRKLGIDGRSGLTELGMDLRRATRAEAAALPTPLTSLIGRGRERAELVKSLGGHRLVTLVGPAGVGKTRLAASVANEVADQAGDHAIDAVAADVRLADLAPVGRELVADTVAWALGVVPRPGSPMSGALREAVAGVHSLLVLDNCEHVIDEAAELVAELLTAGDGLRVLATSREPLGVPGEVVYQVHGLPVPAPQSTAEAVGTYEAVRLFVERAADASPGFTLTDEVTPAVVALCRQLDGLPLAIELAASRARSFGPAELVAHLDKRFDLLSSGARTALPRHRTLRGAIDWSYELLDDAERTLLDRLGVFPAEFDYPAVESVAGADVPVVTVLPNLVDKSLVTTMERGTRRYRLLETIRAYAAERLAASDEATAVRGRHAAHYLDHAEHAAERLRGPEQRVWTARMTAELPNVRAAMAHCAREGDVEAVWRWLSALERFLDSTGQRREAHEWIRRALALGEPPATAAAVSGIAAASMLLRPLDWRTGFDLARLAERLGAGLDDLTRAKAARAVGVTAVWVEPALVQPALHEALTLFGPDQPWESAVTMLSLAITAESTADALRWGRNAVALFSRVGDQMCAANALFVMAQRSIYAGVVDDEVHRWLAESQALAEAAGSEDDRMHAKVGFAQLAWLRGDHARAADLMRECLPTLRRLGDERCTGRALLVLGERAREQGELDQAEELLVQSVHAIALAGQVVVLVNALAALADIACTRDRLRQAALLLGAMRTALDSATPHMRPRHPPGDDLRRRLVDALGPTEFEAAYLEGGGLSPIQALEVISLQP